MSQMSRTLRWGRAWLLLVVVCWPFTVRGDDPLDEYDPTSGWDQVARPPSRAKQKARTEDDFKRQVEDWESVRQAWSEAREEYVQEKRAQTEARRNWRKPAPGTTAGSGGTGGDWGEDAFGGEATPSQPLVTTPAIDRLIDSELEESGATAGTGAGEAGAAPVVPDARPLAEQSQPGSSVPAPFKPASSPAIDSSAPESPSAETPPGPAVVPAPPAQASVAHGESPPAAEADNEEAAAGAAAAEAFLKELQEQQKREQEALRRKAQLKVDEEGQVVDPELKREMEQGPDPEADRPR